MDSVFLLSEEDLSIFFQNMVQEFGCSYLCLWLHSPQSLHSPNCLHYKNGFYIERRSSDQASSSYGTLSQRLFNEYKQSIFILETSHIPGLAFQNNLPYTELNSEDLLTLAATETQRQFYQEAGIKTAVFMGCNAGEIEMGFSTDSQVNLEMQMRNWFPQDLITQLPLVPPPQTTTTALLPQTAHQNPTSTAASSSSSLRSLSYDDSTELYSPFLFDMIPSSSTYGASPETAMAVALRPSSSSSSAFPHQHQHQQEAILQSLGDHMQRDIHTPSLIIEAILASLSSSSTLHATQNVPPPPLPPAHTGTAFKRYRQSLGTRITVSTDRKRRQDMMKRSIVFLRNLNTARAQQANIRPSTTQLHHMISERRRREKINGSFQALRSMLPPTTKKDKASVLASTTEYLSTLKDQVEEFSKRNQILEAQLLSKKTTTTTTTSDSSRGTLDVRITNVGESTSDQTRTVDLHVIMIRNVENNGILVNVVVRLLEFLKLDQNVKLMSIEANTTVVDNSNMENRIVMRLRIEGSAWDESAFQEAVRRIIN